MKLHINIILRMNYDLSFCPKFGNAHENENLLNFDYLYLKKY